MKTLIGFATVAVLIIGLMAIGLKSSHAQEDDAPVKINFRCGSMVGIGEVLVLFEGKITRFQVQCGGPSI